MHQLNRREYQILFLGAAIVPGIVLVAYLMIAWERTLAGLAFLGAAVVVDLLLMLPRARVSTESLVRRRKSAEGFALGIAIVLLGSFLTRLPEYEAFAARLLFDKTLSDWRPTIAVAILILLWILRRRSSIKKLEVDQMAMIFGSVSPQKSQTTVPTKPAQTTAGSAPV